MRSGVLGALGSRLGRRVVAQFVLSALVPLVAIAWFALTQVSDELLAELLTKASRSPSGGNVQPWKIFVLNGDTMARFKEFIASRDVEEAGYAIYPLSLWEPHRTARYELGEQMYALLGIGREDKPARIQRMMDNYRFFDAPAGFFCYLDRRMGPPQWSDCGMFLQTFMLLAEEAGLATCPQEAFRCALCLFLSCFDMQLHRCAP